MDHKPEGVETRSKIDAKVAVLIGGAGTGKTTELMGIMESAKNALGGDPLAIGFATFTRAGRQEAVSRASAAWNIDPVFLTKFGWFRTVHSTCYRQLGVQSGQIIDRSKESQKWVADAVGVPVSVVIDDDSGYSRYDGKGPAAKALNAWELSRARCEPLATTVRRLATLDPDAPTWAECLQYVKRYETAKYRDERFDYSDLLSRYAGVKFTPEGFYGVEPEGELPPSVRAWIFDEAQDASCLVDLVCRRLASGPSVLWVYLAGDPMQSIFSFGGSDSRYFLDWKADKTRTTPRSFRCPPNVMELGERCLRKMRSGYWDRGIAPAEHEGEILRVGGADAAVARLEATTKTLILARCKYSLADYEDSLRKKRIPYAYVNAESDTEALRGCNAYYALERGEAVTGEDLAAAIKQTPVRGIAGVPFLRRGVKTAWGNEETGRAHDMVLFSHLEDIGMEDALISKIKDGSWCELIAGGERWRNAAEKWGAALATDPAIRISTIHASKGMEADTVVLCTSTARRVEEAQEASPEAHDEERRVEYVGVTRARKRLMISRDISDYQMELPL
jgi:superfamily I DNA/RNA helicase